MHNEARLQRLIKKYSLLDSPNEIIFDKLTEEIAKEIGCYGATISIVSASRVWFKSRYGILTDEANVDTSLSKKLVFSQDDFFSVEQFSTHDEYRHHYNHTILSYEFFAAAPIQLENGIRVGALCVFDYYPKKLTDKQISYLKVEANKVAALLQSSENKFDKLESTALSKEASIVKKISSLGDFGGFYANAKSKELKWNHVNNRLLNLQPDWSPEFNDLYYLASSSHFEGTKDVYLIMKDIQALIQNLEVTQYSHLYVLNFLRVKSMYLSMIYHRIGDDIYVVFKNETRFLDLAQKDSLQKKFLLEVESISKIGGWEYIVSTKKIQFSKNATFVLGIQPVPEISLDSFQIDKRIIDLDLLWSGFKQALNKREEYIGDHKYKPVGKSSKTLRVKGRPIFINERLVRVVGTIQDISEDKAHLDLIALVNTNTEKQVDFYKTLINNSNIFIFQLSEVGELLFSNAPYNLAFGGGTKEELVGRNELLEHSEENRSKILDVISRCLANPEKSFPLRLERIDSSGTNTVTIWECCSIGNKSENSPDILFIGIDHTDFEKNKEDLLKLVDRVTLQNEGSIEFGNIINHHFRSQVANLQGLIQLMELRNSPEEKMDYFSHLKKTVTNLLEITQIVSSVLHIQNNKSVEYTSVDIERLVDSIVSEFWQELLSDPFDLDLQIPEGFSVLTVRKYLHLILKELIANAIRFRKPNIPLKISIKALKKRNSTVLIVSDNGVGIDLELYKDRMFKLYDTLTINNNYKGTGLYMTKVRVSALGGKISVKSIPQEGASFHIELPDEKN